MADTKLADLTSGAPAAATDIIYAVKDPGGTPSDAKLTLGEVKTLVNTPGGSNTQVQFNDGGAFAGDSGLTFNKTSKSFSLGGATVTADAPVIDASQTWNASGVTFTGMRLNVTDTASAAASLLMDLQVGGVSRCRIDKAGTTTSDQIIGVNNVQTNNYFTINSNTARIFFGTTNDVILRRRGAANLQLGAADAASPVAQTLSVQSVVAGTSNTAGANLTITGSQGTGDKPGGSIIFQVAPAGSSGTAQNSLVTFIEATSARAFNLYNTTDVTTNYERGFVRWSSNVLQIGTEKAGTGTARALHLQTDGVTRLTIDTSDNFVFGSTFTNKAFTFTNVGFLYGRGNGIFQLTNSNETGFDRLQFGGTTSSFPALKRSTTSLQARLADDSAFTNIQGKLTTETAYTAGAPTATGYIVLYDSTGTAYKVPAEAL